LGLFGRWEIVGLRAVVCRCFRCLPRSLAWRAYCSVIPARIWFYVVAQKWQLYESLWSNLLLNA
jgi:hypothetical protein